jgi:hypothetical protein
MWQGGNQWAAWASYLSFFRHVAELPLDYSAWNHWEMLAEHSGPRIMHSDFCIISDRPARLLVDSENRPHCQDGPFCQWRDGSALYAVHGVFTPAWIIERPDLVTAQKIDEEPNAEIRRVMVDQMGVERFLREGNARKLHTDPCGVLWTRPVKDDEPLMSIELLNSTPETDGQMTRDEALLRFDKRTPVAHDGMMIPLCQAPESLRFKSYFLRVDPKVRTAKEAVAWTFDMKPQDYNLAFQS